MNSKLAPKLDSALRHRWEPVYKSRLQYLVTWATRGRRPVLKDRHAEALRTSVPRWCEERGFELLDLGIGRDHVHLLIGLRPAQSVASAVREIKSRAGLELMAAHPELRVWLGGNLLWDERYSVETVSPTRLDRVQRRLRELHGPSEPLAATG